MLGLRRGTGMAAALIVAAVMLPEVAAVRYTVGDNGHGGWSTVGGNYTNWTSGIHFYNGDWLYFVYTRYLYQVLEVNRSTYYNCTLTSPDPSIKNFTGGAGRDVVALNETRDFYFISSAGYCLGGMKLMVHVENRPPPPSSPPPGSGSHSILVSTFRARAWVPALVAAAAVWDSLLLLL